MKRSETLIGHLLRRWRKMVGGEEDRPELGTLPTEGSDPSAPTTPSDSSGSTETKVTDEYMETPDAENRR